MGYLFSILLPENSILVTLVTVLLMTQVLGKYDIVVGNLESDQLVFKYGMDFAPTRWSVPLQLFEYVEEKGKGVPEAVYRAPPFPECKYGLQNEEPCEFRTFNRDSAKDPFYPENCMHRTLKEDCKVSLIKCQDCCEYEKLKAINLRKDEDMQVWFQERSVMEYCKSSYDTLKKHGSVPGMNGGYVWWKYILFGQGLLLHVVAFLYLKYSSGDIALPTDWMRCTASP
jgi:hypothetical protein